MVSWIRQLVRTPVKWCPDQAAAAEILKKALIQAGRQSFRGGFEGEDRKPGNCQEEEPVGLKLPASLKGDAVALATGCWPRPTSKQVLMFLSLKMDRHLHPCGWGGSSTGFSWVLLQNIRCDWTALACQRGY